MRTLIALSLATVVAAANVVGCSDTGTKVSPSPTRPSGDVITLGLLGTFGGAEADTARQVRLGAELAASQINALGGVLGKRIAFRIEDDEGRPEVAREKMTAMVKDGVALGIGPTTSAMGTAVLDLLRSDQALFISPSASSPDLDLPDAVGGNEPLRPNLLRTIPSDARQASALIVVASQDRDKMPEDPSLKPQQARCRKAIFVYQKDAYGTPIYERALVRALGVNIEIASAVELNPSDATESTLKGTAGAVAQSAINAKADCQIVIAQAGLGGAYMRSFRAFISDPVVELKRNWPSLTTLGSDGFTQEAFVTSGRTEPANPLSDTAGNGSVAVAPNTRPTSSQAYNVFLQGYLARNPGTEPGQFTTTAYDAVMMLALAIERAKSPDQRPALRQALADLSIGEPTASSDLQLLLTRVRTGVAVNYEGVSGPVDFLETGGVDGDFAIGRIEKNRFTAYRLTLPSSTLAQ